MSEDALRNSVSDFPTVRPISGSFFGPNTIRAIRRIRISSGGPTLNTSALVLGGLVLVLALALLEFPRRLPDRPREVGQLLPAEQQQHDGQDDDQFRRAQV